ncbi:MAG: hypothetical protein OXG56_04470 [Gammaproteobacteria bacterium]|nr:hypothetical protein [Gammaproteobacteria bacterium]
MNAFVVDTNVPVVANGGDQTHADSHCQKACVEKLKYLADRGTVVIDDIGLILVEYANRLSMAGRPGAGNAFLKYLWDNQYCCSRIKRVRISESDDEHVGFKELPKNNLDPSDRKFLAVAVVARAAILNATDSAWEEQASLMECLGVDIHQLCPEYAGG